MILPRLNIFENNSMNIEIYDSNFSNIPLMSINCKKNTCEIFYILLKSFVNQYNYGYETGILDTEENYETILEKYEEYIKKLLDDIDE